MAASLVPTKHWLFIVICVGIYCLISIFTGQVNTKSVWRMLRITLLFVPVIFSMSYFLVWRILVVKPRSRLVVVQAESHSSETKHAKTAGVDRKSIWVVLFYIWTAVLFVIVLLTHLCLLSLAFMGKTTEVNMVRYALFVCLGTFLILVAVLVIFELSEFFLRITVLRGVQWRWFQENWYFIRVMLVSVIVCGLVTLSMINAAKGPVVEPVELPVRKLPLSMNGLRIVQMSDTHVGPTVGRSQLQQSVNTANSLKPDIIVLTGDLVDSTVENLAEAVSPLGQLKAPYGVYYVTGNHEYYTYDVNNWLAHLESLGITCLPNRHVKITNQARAQDWFYLAGTNDLEASRMHDKEDHFNLDKALDGTDSDHAIILLAHQPRAAQQAIQSEYDISLILSGHTHGGQFFPTNVIAYLINPYYAGIYQPKEGTYVYVSSGTWYNGPPMRLFSRAEITLITLLSA